MMKLKQSLYMVLCLMVGYILTGCVEEYEADISAEDSDLLVVEGTICSSKLNKFILSRSQAISSANADFLLEAQSYSQTYTPRIVTGGKVSVRGSDGSEYLTQQTDGYYSCWIDDLNPDVKYYLHIEVNGEVYESEPQKPLRTEKIEDVRGVQNTPESNIDVLITPEAPFDPDKASYYSWTYDETWEVHADYTTVMFFDTNTLTRIYKAHLFPECGWKDATGSTIMVGASTSYDGQHIQRLKLYDLYRGNERMFYRYSGLIHQRAISKAEYEYELARRQAGSEMGGLFTPQPSALPTNIHCLTSNKHVIGYVGCSLNTSEYRFFLDAKDFSIYHPQPTDARIWLHGCSEEDCLRMVNQGFFLCEWQEPLNSPDFLLHTAWATLEQLDVRYGKKGSYIEEPDFWSLEEDGSEY